MIAQSPAFCKRGIQKDKATAACGRNSGRFCLHKINFQRIARNIGTKQKIAPVLSKNALAFRLPLRYNNGVTNDNNQLKENCYEQYKDRSSALFRARQNAGER
jgi:hypothetical protein